MFLASSNIADEMALGNSILKQFTYTNLAEAIARIDSSTRLAQQSKLSSKIDKLTEISRIWQHVTLWGG
jgi:hypothetical protein